MVRQSQGRAWGIEQEGPAAGELVCPVIFLWKKPGGLMLPDNMAGALAHGAEVTVVREKKHKGRTWCFVRNDEQNQKGWLVATMLKEYGKRGQNG